MPYHPFEENVVILTGASHGIGEQLAYQLASQGAHLALVVAANASWSIFPLIIFIRFGLNEHPFTRRIESRQAVEMGA